MESSSGGVTVDNDTIQTNATGEIYVAGLAAMQLEMAQNEIELIELQANATVTPIDHDTLISDTYSDTTGYDNTVTTGTTTATFSTNKYTRNNGLSNATDAHGLTLTANSTNTVYVGMKITVKTADIRVSAVNVHASCNATRCRISQTGGTLVQLSTDRTGNTFTFSPVVTLTASTSYRIEVDSSGAAYNEYRNTSPGYPKNATNLNYASGSYSNTTDDANTAWNLLSVVSESGTADDTPKVIKHALPTITGTVTDLMLVVNAPERETGDSVTFDITDGATTLTGQALNTKIAWTGANVPTVLTINLVAKSSSPTNNYPSVKSYALKLWKAA